MSKFDAFNVGEQIIMVKQLSNVDVTRRLGGTLSLKFSEKRAVGAVGQIFAVFPKQTMLYVKVDGVSTAMLFVEVEPFTEERLEAILNPPSTDWMPMHNWLG